MENREEYNFSVKTVKDYLRDLYSLIGYEKYYKFMINIDHNYKGNIFIADAEFLLNAIENNKVSQNIIDQIIEFQIANL